MSKNIKLEWEQSSFIDEFVIERKVGGEAWQQIASTQNLYYFDTNIEEEMDYEYRVGAVRGQQVLYSSTVSVSTHTIIVNDPFWNNVELLIYADALTFPSSNIIDSSSFSRVIYKAGNPQIVDTESHVDAGSIYLTGLSEQYVGLSSLSIGTSDFTVECFAKFPSMPASSAFDAYLIDLNSIKAKITDNELCIYLGSGAESAKHTILRSSWNHYCLMRKSGVVYLFANGVKVAQIYALYDLTSYAVFGGGAIARRTVNAWLNCCRITKVARYSELGFTPPTEKFPNS